MDAEAVIAAVCARCAADGFETDRHPLAREHGVDVLAIHPETGVRILIDTTAGVRPPEDSVRYGKPYDRAQTLDRVSRGVFSCLQLRAAHPDRCMVRVMFAVPEDGWFGEYARAVAMPLHTAGVEVWFAPAHVAQRDDMLAAAR